MVSAQFSQGGTSWASAASGRIAKAEAPKRQVNFMGHPLWSFARWYTAAGVGHSPAALPRWAPG